MMASIAQLLVLRGRGLCHWYHPSGLAVPPNNLEVLRYRAVLQGVGQMLDVFIHAFKYPIHMQGIQARPHLVAFWVGAHELCQTFEPIANQLRLS